MKLGVRGFPAKSFATVLAFSVAIVRYMGYMGILMTVLRSNSDRRYLPVECWMIRKVRLEFERCCECILVYINEPAKTSSPVLMTSPMTLLFETAVITVSVIVKRHS